ncbi:hypothetical protein BGX20_008608 [Mortierella sp. AD010]|nr:hypothetical protein BGX20_008608 [Mortierella sp. AD010]
MSLLTSHQYSKVLQVLRASWRQLLESVLVSTELTDSVQRSAVIMSYLGANCQASFGCDITASQQAYYSGSLLLVILKVLVEQLECIRRPIGHVPSIDGGQRHNATRSSLKAKTKARLLSAQKSLEIRCRREHVEKYCVWISEVANVVSSGYQLQKRSCEQTLYLQQLEEMVYFYRRRPSVSDASNLVVRVIFPK